MKHTNVKRDLLKITRKIKAKNITDIANILKVSRQAVQQKAIYHGVYEELKKIFRINKPLWSKAPKVPGIVVFQRGQKKIYWYSKTNLQYIIKELHPNFKTYKISYIITKKRDTVLECLKKRFKDSNSRLLYENEGEFPYISYRDNLKRYRVYTPKEQKFIAHVNSFGAAKRALKNFILQKKSNKKKTFINTINKNDLYNLYIKRGLNLNQIAIKLNVSTSTVYLHLKKFNIPIKKIGRPKKL